MVRFYYPVLFLASLVMTTVFMSMWKKHDVHITLIFILAPVINLGCFFLSTAQSLDAAHNAIKITYLSCYLQMIIMLAIFSLCKIRLKRWVTMSVMILTTLVFLSSLTIGYTDWFYKGATMDSIEGITILHKQYGSFHSLLYAVIILFFAIGIIAIIYSRFRKRQISRRLLTLLILPQLVCMVSFFGGRLFLPEMEFLPVSYCFAELVYMLVIRRINLYDVTDIVMESIAESGDTGFITFDTRFNYLGCNDTALKILPELGDLAVDLSLKENARMEALLLPWLKQYQQDPDNIEANGHFYEKDDRIYLFTVGELPGQRSRRGYRIVITDDTLDRAYIKLLDGFNQDLKDQVAQKTEDIVRMNDNMILGMAVMVESRGNSTGGHIRRTSDVVRMLVDVLRKEGMASEGYDLTDEFCSNLIKAAPMHDLGKIAVDDAVLRKPGRFTPEEFEKMKAHASEGARIVHEILKGTDVNRPPFVGANPTRGLDC